MGLLVPAAFMWNTTVHRHDGIRESEGLARLQPRRRAMVPPRHTEIARMSNGVVRACVEFKKCLVMCAMRD